MTTGIQSKLPEVGTTIFTTMSALANEHKAINLGQGFPDYDMPEELMSLVNKAMHDGFNQYVPMQGYLPLREAISQKVSGLYNASVNPDTDITITPGGTYAIYTALTTVLKPGDEVIVFQPCYDSYIPNIVLNGATPVFVDLSYPDYRIDWKQVKNKITPHTRMIMLNSPHIQPAQFYIRKTCNNWLRLYKTLPYLFSAMKFTNISFLMKYHTKAYCVFPS